MHVSTNEMRPSKFQPKPPCHLLLSMSTFEIILIDLKITKLFTEINHYFFKELNDLYPIS